MPKCEFSETQYSFGYTFEFITNYIPWTDIFPFFPSTGMEGKTGFGYDALINHNLFFQFKIPFYATKKHQKTKDQWNAHKNPYYRIVINTDGNQFKQLKDLKTPNNEVFYCSPEFNTQIEFQNSFFLKELVENSVLFSIDDLPNYKSGRHNMTFKPKDYSGILFSVPTEVKKHNIKSILEKTKVGELSLRKELTRIIKLFEIKISVLSSEEDNFYQTFNYVRLELHSKFNIIWLPILEK